MNTSSPQITIPAELLPRDGRFGSGPSKIRDEQINSLLAAQKNLLGTSHRKDPVKNIVAEIKAGLAELFQLPDGYEVVIGNGGSTAFWEVATFSLIKNRAQHCVIGEFSAKFAASTAAAPFLAQPELLQAAAGSSTAPLFNEDVDVYAYAHNETSTGVMQAITNPAVGDQLVLVDATSAAGAIEFDISQTDVYYFAPQKSFGSDGGLWIALASPKAITEAAKIATSKRYIPDFLSFDLALDNSRLNQTLNTPALTTLLLLNEQLRWFKAQGGLAWADQRTKESSTILHNWVNSREELDFFVSDPSARSQVVTTIELDPAIDSNELIKILRAHGILDIDPYRKLGRNQIRVATFPAIEPQDVVALTNSINFVLDRH